MERPGWVSEEINVDRPSASRIYDYYLGGSHNFAIDRKNGDMATLIYPGLPRIMRANRSFLRRATRFLATEAGIDQFLDIGSGIPTVGNVHEIAQATNPEARIVYVDIDPVAVTHSRSILAGNDRTAVLHADFRQPEQILADPDVTRLIDFDRPVALLLVALLHFVPDEDGPAEIIARLREALPSGSYLVLSHISTEGDPEQVAGLQRLSKATPTPLAMRAKQDIAPFFTGFELVEPGLVYLPQWRPESPDEAEGRPETYNDFCGVGRKP